ncbi:MAG: beta-N-acetylhexosaminidase [Acidobacteriaceae bacterium]|nr:beta-N-acetylhexosaminidase [Acidobacteriaceae bacterium]
MSAPLRHAVGSLLVVGLGGTELSAMERAWLRIVRPGGVILFQRNVADAAQTRALLDEATGLASPHAARCVDVEGGAVNRLRTALAPLPSAQAVACAMRTLRKPALAHTHGELVARAVRAFGFNTTLAPVLDLGLPESAAALGTRTAGATPDEIIADARGFLAGLAAHGVTGCGKHFPGLGGGVADSHVATPSIARTLRQLTETDLAPYRALVSALPMVMVNHAAYPRTAGGATPASVSRFWITTMLRKQLGYRGLVFSDDFEMGGILNHLPLEDAVLEAVRAGMDLIEICKSPELVLRAYEALLCEAERSSAFALLIAQRAREVARKRAKLYAAPAARPLTDKQLAALRTRIEQFNAQVAKAVPHEPSARTATRAEAS